MKRADLTLFIDGAGKEHVAIVTDENTDGTVDLAVLKATLKGVPRSSIGTPHSAFDIDAPLEQLPAEETIEVGKVAVLRPSPGAQEKFFTEGAQAGQSLFQGDLIRPTSDGGVEVLPGSTDMTALAGAETGSKQEGTDAQPAATDQGPVSGG